MPEQVEVVRHEGGPLLVVAGPGSGKTRVITERVASRIADGKVAPHKVLAVTFTQSAAAEMRTRIAALLGHGEPLHVGTFHWMSAALLRRYIYLLGYRRDFKVLSPSQARHAMSRAWESITGRPGDLARLRSAVSSVRNGASVAAAGARHGVDPAQIARSNQIYDGYKRRQNVVDLDDLLTLTAQVLREHPRVRLVCRQAHGEIVVDEFQDINPVQFELLELLAPLNRSVVVVGDDDQSIYAWRQALPNSLNEFEKRFPDCRVVALQNNFRSSKHIVRTANTLIARNHVRIATSMTTDNPAGESVVCFRCDDELHEAQWIAESLKRLNDRHNVAWDDMAVIMRVNSLARALEEACVRHAVPYCIQTRYRFFERPEVRHAAAYARLAMDRLDDASAELLINSLRGVGPAHIARMRDFAAERGVPLIEIVLDKSVPHGLLPLRARPGVETLAAQLTRLWDARNFSVPAIMDLAIQATRETLETDLDDDFLAELASLARDVHRQRGTLRSLLERLDHLSDATDSGKGVHILSIHAAKGLEFHTVFLAAVEEGLLPHRQSLNNEESVEEERRLCYVGMTRAKERLFLSYACNRTVAGTSMPRTKSRFIGEMRGAGVRYERASSGSSTRGSVSRMNRHGRGTDGSLGRPAERSAG